MGTNTRLRKAEAAALAALEPGGILSVESLAKSAGLTRSAARSAVLSLRAAGLIYYGGMPSRSGYQITYRGRSAIPVRHRFCR
jgi:predicted transcriptional regulator